MKKINLRRISETLSEKELKNVMGGSNYGHCSQSGPCSGSCGSINLPGLAGGPATLQCVRLGSACACG